MRKLLLISLALCSILAVAQPPNDNFVNAFDVTSLINSCSAGGANFTTLAATADQVKGSCWSNGPNYNTWFKFTATTSFINVRVNVSATSMQYPFVALWSSATTQLACMDQNGSKANISFSYLGLSVGTVYYISVDNFAGAGFRGTFNLCLSDVVDNDYPQGATTLTSTSCTAGGTYSTLYAVADHNNGTCWSNGPNYNRWFKFVATTDFINVQVKVAAPNTMQYPFVALWDATFIGQLACMDQNGAKVNTALSYKGLTIGNTYYISVDNFAGLGYRGSFDLCLTDVVDYDYPEGAVSLTSTSCSAGGTYNTLYASPDHLKGSCWSNGPNYNRWFKFVATTDFINIQVNVAAPNTMQYPFVALWDGTFTGQLACMDLNGAKANIALSYKGLSIGTTYYISVDNFAGLGYRGSFDLCLTDGVDYDYPEGAVSLTSTSCSTGGTYNTLYASADHLKATCWSNGPNYNRWFKFIATTDFINVQVKVAAPNTMQYPFVALWDATFVSQLSCMDQNGAKVNTALSYKGLTIGNTYYISVDNFAGLGYRGSFDLCLTDVVDYDYPEGAVSLTSTSCSTGGTYNTLYANPDHMKGSCWSSGPNYNRWFKFVATTDFINIQVKVVSPNTMQYPLVALWDGTFTGQLACMDLNGAKVNIALSYKGLTIGTTYYISVDNFAGTGYRGSFDLCLTDVVDYDYPEGAVSLTSTSCSTGGTYNTLYANPDHLKATCWSNGPNYNRWFKFVATTDFINIQVNVASPNSMQYPFVALWDATFVGQLACMDQNGAKVNLALSYKGLAIGTTYYISVDNFAGTGYRGSFDVCLSDVVDYDYPEGAKDLTSLINTCSSGGAYTTTYATPDHIKGTCWSNGPNYNRWFKFQATATGFINVQVKVSTTSMQYPALAIWDNSFTTQLACADQNGSKVDINVSYLGLTPGNYYYISVDNFAGLGYRGTFDLCLSDVLDYDFYAGAVPLTNLNNWCSPNAAYSTLYATPDKTKGSCWNNGPNYNRWFKFVAITANATIQVMTGGANGTMQYPYMALWQSNGTTQIACVQYSAQYTIASITTSALVVGNTYYISVDNFASLGYRGTFKLCINNIGTTFYSRANGLWNSNNTWSTAGFGGAVASSFPNAGDVALIQGNDVNVTSNQQAAEVDLTVATAGTSLTVDNAILTVNGLTSLANGGNNFSGAITIQNNGSLRINDVLNVLRMGGNQPFGITVNTGCSLIVNSDMAWSSTAGSVNSSLLTVSGSGTVTVGRDLTLSSIGGPLMRLQFNNTSQLNVIRDISYSANAGGLELIELNNTARLRLGRSMIRGGTPYGSLTSNNTSTVEYNGSVFPQTTGGDAGAGGDAFFFTNVTINNTSPATPQVVLGGATTVHGNLTMTTGVVGTTATNVLNLLNATVTTIGGTSTYIDGPMTYEVATSTANTVRNFPIGKGGSWRPAVLTVTHSDNTSVIYTSEHIGSSAAALGYSFPVTIDKVSSVRYWQIDRAAVPNLTTARVRLYYGAGTGDGVTDFTNLTVVKNVGVGTAWLDIGGTASGNGSGNILSGAFTAFCRFTIANRVGGTNPLPVELLNFDAKFQNGVVALTWATASELNNDYFTVERSRDGVEFEDIATVKGAGTKNSASEYVSTDQSPWRGTSYYRLRQTDFSHRSASSKVVVVDSYALSAAVLQVYPNPSDGKNLKVKLAGFEEQEELVLSLSDSFGRMVLTVYLRSNNLGACVADIAPDATVASGMYLLRISSKRGSLFTKVIIQH